MPASIALVHATHALQVAHTQVAGVQHCGLSPFMTKVANLHTSRGLVSQSIQSLVVAADPCAVVVFGSVLGTYLQCRLWLDSQELL